jgi:pimeloyl-ACP methyl ester carboxylesterase
VTLKPVVFIPGFPASELRLAATGEVIFPPSLGIFFDAAAKQRLLRLLTGPDDPPGSVVAGEPIRTVLDIAKQAQTLYDILSGTYGYITSGGTNFAPVGWDWRGAVDADRVRADVAAAIDSLAAQNGGAKVVVIIHSTGGPVFRRCLELQPAIAAKVERILALGIPWAGTLKSFPFITTGETFGPFPPLQLSAQEVQGIMSHAQAAYDLLPPDPAKTDMTDASGRPLDLFVDGSGAQQGPLVDLLWVRGGPEQDYMRRNAADADRRLGSRGSTITLDGGAAVPPITNIGGWGTSTQTRCTIDGAGQLAYALTPEGDGTIPLVSARWLRGAMVQSYVLPIGAYPVGQIPMVHSQIWNSPPMIQIFNQVLLGAPPAPFVCCAADGDDAVDPEAAVVRLRLAAADAAGLRLPNLQATVRGIAQPVNASIPGFRAVIEIPRTSFHANVGSDLCRFSIEVIWDGDRRELPMLIHV